MRCCWMKSSGYFLVGLVLMIFVLTDLAEAQKEILTIGKAQSPVLSQLKRGRAAKDAREAVKEAKEKVKGQGKDANEQRQKEKDELKNRLKNVDAVVADLSEVTPSDDDKLLAEAAKEAEVPIVLEKVDGKKMADLLGVGADVKLAALESSKGKGKLHVWDDSPAELSDSKVENEKLDLKLTPEQKAEVEKRGEKEQIHPPVKVEKSTKAKETKGYEQAAADVENILRNRPFSRGARSQAITDKAAQWIYEVDTYWNAYYWNPGGVPLACFDRQYNIGIYASSVNKYIVVRQTGGIWGRMNWDSKTNRGYFIEKLWTQMDPTGDGYLPPSWILASTKPDNANNQTTIATTLGFDITASYPPSAGISASRSETKTLTDWRVVNQTLPPKGEWEYSLSKGGYKNPQDLIGTWGYLDGLPAISTNGWQAEGAFAESMWKGPANSTGTAKIALRSRMTVRHTWISWHLFWVDWWSSYSSAYRGTWWYFNTSVVSLPSL